MLSMLSKLRIPEPRLGLATGTITDKPLANTPSPPYAQSRAISSSPTISLIVLGGFAVLAFVAYFSLKWVQLDIWHILLSARENINVVRGRPRVEATGIPLEDLQQNLNPARGATTLRPSCLPWPNLSERSSPSDFSLSSSSTLVGSDNTESAVRVDRPEASPPNALAPMNYQDRASRELALSDFVTSRLFSVF